MEKRGEKIPGSKFYRVFCKDCGEPMRTTLHEVDDEHQCRECGPFGHPGYGNGVEIFDDGEYNIDAFKKSTQNY